jgi:hypothetical protein
MKAVVTFVAPLMKEHGFRKRRHCFNRRMDDGIVHVLDFQMGPYEPIPPNLSEADKDKYVEFRTRIFGRFSLYGLFTINLGVHIPELEDALFRGNPPSSSFIPEYRCHVRTRLGQLSEGNDAWWGLDLPVAELGLLMTELIKAHAIPFLDLFPTRDALVAQTETEPASVPWQGPPRLQLAIIAAHLGDERRARSLLQAHYDETILHPRNLAHHKYVEQVAERLGYELVHPLKED